jgi:hypothetical protein
MNDGSDPFPLGIGKIIRETEKAVLAQIEEKQVWIPKSVIHDDSEAFSTADGENVGSIVTKRWWAEKNGHA